MIAFVLKQEDYKFRLRLILVDSQTVHATYSRIA